MLSSLARFIGLEGPVPPRRTRLLCMLTWAPGKANEDNLLKVEVKLGACLGLCKKKVKLYRFQSTWKQPDHICHCRATDAHASQLNSQQFFCWFFYVEDGATDLARTVSATLEELGVVDGAVVQFRNLVTIVEGRTG